MDVEIVEFYPAEKKEDGGFTGSLHVYVIPLGMDLRGVYVSFDPKAEKKWYFKLPTSVVIDKETGEKKKFPYINFTNRRKQLDLVKDIRFRGKPYIQKNYLMMEDIVEPPKAEKKIYGKGKQPFNKPKFGKPPGRFKPRGPESSDQKPKIAAWTRRPGPAYTPDSRSPGPRYGR
jgi:hypothetical protein